MEVKEIDIQALVRRIACGETTAEDADVLRAILEMFGLDMSPGDQHIAQ